MSRIFHGPLRYWLMLAAVVGLLTWMGRADFHTRHFNLFLLTLIAIAAAVVGFTVATYRKGEHVTREPIDLDERRD